MVTVVKLHDVISHVFIFRVLYNDESREKLCAYIKSRGTTKSRSLEICCSKYKGNSFRFVRISLHIKFYNYVQVNLPSQLKCQFGMRTSYVNAMLRIVRLQRVCPEPLNGANLNVRKVIIESCNVSCICKKKLIFS